MLDAIKHTVDDNIVFQQDNAPVHLAFNTVQLLQCKSVNFFSSKLWPYKSPELNSTLQDLGIRTALGGAVA